jgi:TetR/AcrR family transcriptional regulator, tetracycline repressor protein
VAPPKSSTRPTLSPARVVEQVVAVADADGIEAVTIRRLATELGVTPMALYWHFPTKDDLLAGAADLVLDGVTVPAPADGWDEDLRALMTALVTALGPHPQLALLVSTRMLVHPTGLDMTERALAALSRAGFDADRTSALALQLLRSAVSMVTADQVDTSGQDAAERAERLRAKRARLAALPPDRYPALIAHAPAMIGCDAPTYLGAGIDLYVAGVRDLARTA